MSDFAEQLRTADLRVTRPRVAVLEAVHGHPHADTDTIFSAVRSGLPEVSRQAVYDVLHALTAAGLVRRIQPSGSVARYESRVGDNHHHVVCRTCGVIGRRRLRRGRRTLFDAVRHRHRSGWLRPRRGRGHLLGPVPRLLDPDLAITIVITAFSPISKPGRNERG